jgi:flagella basal body P-ring formation protein FlgA
MKTGARYAFLSLMLIVSFEVCAQQVDANLIKVTAENFLRKQTSELAGNVEIKLSEIDSRLKLKPCDKLTPFLPIGSKAWGNMTLGIRCEAPFPWTLHLAAQIKVFGDFYVSSVALVQGQVLTAQDIVKISGELNKLPVGTVLLPNQAIGKVMAASYPAGVSLRSDMFKVIPAILQGQAVKVSSSGIGFTVSNDAIALNNADEGKLARARTSSGQLVSGIAKAGGVIEVVR